MIHRPDARMLPANPIRGVKRIALHTGADLDLPPYEIQNQGFRSDTRNVPLLTVKN